MCDQKYTSVCKLGDRDTSYEIRSLQVLSDHEEARRPGREVHPTSWGLREGDTRHTMCSWRDSTCRLWFIYP